MLLRENTWLTTTKTKKSQGERGRERNSAEQSAWGLRSVDVLLNDLSQLWIYKELLPGTVLRQTERVINLEIRLWSIIATNSSDIFPSQFYVSFTFCVHSKWPRRDLERRQTWQINLYAAYAHAHTHKHTHNLLEDSIFSRNHTNISQRPLLLQGSAVHDTHRVVSGGHSHTHTTKEITVKEKIS